MHKQYFPKCHVDGPIDPPVEFNHLGLTGFMPNKCGRCEFHFEGECLRGEHTVGRYLHLDYGPCGIPGPTDPVEYENEYIKSKVTIPRKCSSCMYLTYEHIRGFTCRKDASKWGNKPRGLDWGTWQPDIVYFDLPLPKITTAEMCRCVTANDLVGFIREYRRVNPGRSIEEAKIDYKIMNEKVNGANKLM